MSEPIMRMNQLSGGQVFRHFHDYMKCGEDSCGICAAIRTCIISIFFPLPQKESGLVTTEHVKLKEKVGEWQKIAKETIDKDYYLAIGDCDLLRDIRDFWKEEK